MSARTEVARRIRAHGVIPVVRAKSADEALRIVAALRAGGLPVVEITLTVPNAVDVIARLTRENDANLLVGAGSVVDAPTARAGIDAGARFVVSPVADAGTIAACRGRDVVAIPGALTPTEILAAARAGADMVKVFPVDALGGAAYLRALLGPLPQLALVPTGGVTLANAGELIAAGAAAVGVGSDLTRGDIATAARAYLDVVRRARGEAVAI
jgi:2-dehydro-3-deoxyphosphogluconate aldolase/(4S)-4-hydroxy-2-oxoglutarate aldolase